MNWESKYWINCLFHKMHNSVAYYSKIGNFTDYCVTYTEDMKVWVILCENFNELID